MLALVMILNTKVIFDDRKNDKIKVMVDDLGKMITPKASS
jgi:hypothetical protein